MVEWLVNSEFERMWMEAVVFWFEELFVVYSWKGLGRSEEMSGKVAYLKGEILIQDLLNVKCKCILTVTAECETIRI